MSRRRMRTLPIGTRVTRGDAVGTVIGNRRLEERPSIVVVYVEWDHGEITPERADRLYKVEEAVA